MKGINNLLSRLRKAFLPRQGKKGASLALVMMIGAVLVIWVMCIMPLMSTTGTAAYQTQGNYDEYLLSRSVIEFCKSELEKIVEEKIPYTFAVTGDLDSGFVPVAKWNETGITVRGEYSALVNSPDPPDDRKDYPTSDSVMAICAVEPNDEDPGIYDIVITTYRNCEVGMTYTATFTPKGSLLVYPEAYGDERALPLSDFVVVDGKMGPNIVWNSTITFGSATGLGFSETLLPFKLPSEMESNYANTGEYPAVFKTTALAAAGNSAIGTPVADDRTKDVWIEPVAVANTTKAPGSIWYTVDKNGTIAVKLYTDKEVTITDDCTVYMNGEPRKSAPTRGGTYQVIIDYTGTGEYVEDGINILPVQGLVMPNYYNITVTTGKNNISDEEAKAAKVTNIERIVTKDESNNEIVTYTVTLAKQADDMLYGCYSSDGAPVWSRSNMFTGLEGGKNYFFYICRPASIDENGNFMETSGVKESGAVYFKEALTYATALEPGQKYLFLNSDGSKMLTAGLELDDVPSPTSDFSSYLWTVGGSGSNLSFKNSNGTYLNMGGSAVIKYNETKTDHDHWLVSCKKYVGYVESWNMSVSNGNSKSITVSNSGTDFVLSVAVTDSDTHDDYSCLYGKNKTFSFDTTARLNLNNGVSATTDSATVRFIKIPANPTVSAPSIAYTISSNAFTGSIYSHIQNNLEPKHSLNKVYVNGQELAKGTDYLNTGIYHTLIRTNVGTDAKADYRTGVLGNLYVMRTKLNAADLTFTLEEDEVDDMKVHVSVSGLHENGGNHYFGYRLEGEDENAFRWFPSTESSYTFCLDYGDYVFAVKETGDKNHEGCIVTGEHSIEPRFVELSTDQKNEFIFTFDETTKEVVWYHLPENIKPGRVQLVFGIPVGTDAIRWTDTYSEDARFYGVIVLKSAFDSLENVLQLSQPVGITNVNGRTSSVMRGSSLYFMGQSNSINTYGNSVYLYTDLLVLNKDITGGGKVYVEPFSKGDGKPGDTLLFIANSAGIKRNGEVIFEGRQFYRIPANRDICNLNSATTAQWKIGGTRDSNVKYLFRQGVFPEINLDIAYADKDQLSHIVSGETIGWTNKGVLSGSNETNNGGYAICAYVTDMSGSVSYRANRILIAGKASDGTNTLYVPSDLTFTTRYLSVDAEHIIQGANDVEFILNNLGETPSYVKWLVDLGKALGLTNYCSKSLQMDYERSTYVGPLEGGYRMSAQICRYNDGTNLFAGMKNQPLMATYTTKEIEHLFENGLSGLIGSTVKTVDRYVSLVCDDGSGSIDVGAIGSLELNIYANYIYIDSSVTSIKLSSLFSSDIKVSSQESGYTTEEYLGLFKNHTAETYKGTLLYFTNTVKITYKTGIFSRPKTAYIAPGFYYINADESGEGTSLSILADRAPLDPEVLKEYSVYINPDGTLSNAYVDTGLLDNNTVGAGGFSGGSMG